jgi:type II secretory pathway component GspD/PulD (secretin)
VSSYVNSCLPSPASWPDQDYKPAFINVGGVVNAVIAPGVSGAAGKIQQINAGITLKVLPRVIEDNSGKPVSMR